MEGGDDDSNDSSDAAIAGSARRCNPDRRGSSPGGARDRGRVFLHGELSMASEPGDDVCRRLAAVQLVWIKAAKAVQVAAGFGVDPDTLRRWAKTLTG